jgi:hypothetical protein
MNPRFPVLLGKFRCAFAHPVSVGAIVKITVASKSRTRMLLKALKKQL